jgi:hypothetical protein
LNVGGKRVFGHAFCIRLQQVACHPPHDRPMLAPRAGRLASAQKKRPPRL